MGDNSFLWGMVDCFSTTQFYHEPVRSCFILLQKECRNYAASGVSQTPTCVYAWGVRRNGKVTYYDVKAKVRLNRNTSFFLKSFLACTLEFYTTNGKIEFPQYRMRVRKGAVVRLPDVFCFGGFLLTGWSTKIGVTAPMYQPGQKYTVQKSVKFYRTSRSPENASKEKNGKIIYLMHKDGSFFKAIRRTANCTFPDYRPADGSTMLGWSRKQGQRCDVLARRSDPEGQQPLLYGALDRKR